MCACYRNFIVETARWYIEATSSRGNSLIAKLTPQSFHLTDIIGAHRRALAEGRHDFIDSCTMMSYYGYKLDDNRTDRYKITTPTDFLCFVLWSRCMKISRYLDFRNIEYNRETWYRQLCWMFPLAEMLRERRFVITGATGLLGACMVKCLLALNKRYSLGLHVTIGEE